MIKAPDICGIFSVCIVFFVFSNTYASERKLEADVDARVETNDNIFLTDQPHDTVNGIIITPTLSGSIKEENWNGYLKASVKSHNYSDRNINSNDQYFDLTGQYLEERNIFALNINYDLASNLNTTSTDFGVVGRRINTKIQSILPKYTRLITERLSLILSYNYTDVDFLDAENTGFTPYVTESGSASLTYDLTEVDKFTIGITAVDYVSKDELVTYKLFSSRVGVAHKVSETLTTDVLIGISRRNSTNLQTLSFDFFGEPVIQTTVIDSSNRGLVFDMSVTKLLENGTIIGKASRNDSANSFGGINQTNRISLVYDDAYSELWKYEIRGRFDDITSIGSSSVRTDRIVLLFSSTLRYSISQNWYASFAYEFTQRKFKRDTSDSRAPLSNRFYMSLTYNFPSLSTY